MSTQATDRIFAERFFGSIKNPESAALLITSCVNRRYVSGFYAAEGAVLITNKKSIYLTDFRYITDARRYLKNMELCETNTIAQTLNQYFIEQGIKTVYIEQNNLTVKDAQAYANSFASAVIENSDLADRILADMRSTKDDGELELIKASQSITERAFDHILGYIKRGMTERQIALEIEFFMRSNGAERVAFDLIVCSGENGDCPHAIPGERKICDGDFITMDIGAVYNGLHSDMTRTVAVGQISQKQRDVYNIVLSAQLAAIQKAAAGVPCADVDKAARSIIESYGYGACFGHSTGHGVGLEIHEAPRVSSLSSGILKKGMVITAEPGIYIPGEFGVRIEDMLYITESGNIDLTSSPKELIIL